VRILSIIVVSIISEAVLNRTGILNNLLLHWGNNTTDKEQNYPKMSVQNEAQKDRAKGTLILATQQTVLHQQAKTFLGSTFSQCIALDFIPFLVGEDYLFRCCIFDLEIY